MPLHCATFAMLKLVKLSFPRWVIYQVDYGKLDSNFDAAKIQD